MWFIDLLVHVQFGFARRQKHEAASGASSGDMTMPPREAHSAQIARPSTYPGSSTPDARLDRARNGPRTEAEEIGEANRRRLKDMTPEEVCALRPLPAQFITRVMLQMKNVPTFT
jgi:hypothetical protein